MTLKDIAVFKKFIANKDLRREFIRVYNRSKDWAKLPNTIEEYFSNVDPYAVITKAVRICKPNTAYGYSFWQELNEEWKVNFKKMQSSHFYQEMIGMETLSGYFAILRENWNDVEKPWRFEDIPTARQRLGLEPLPQEEEPTKQDEEFTQGETNMTSEVIEEPENEADDLEIDFVEIDKTSRIANGLRSGIISVNTRSHSYKIGINRIDTKTIKSKQVKYAHVGKIKQNGDVIIQLNNNSKGVQMACTSDGYFNINSRQFVENLRRMMDITDDLVYLRIEKIAEKMDSITYKVTKQQ